MHSLPLISIWPTIAWSPTLCSSLHVPVIFLTGKNKTDDIIKGFEVGAADYITKPYQSQELLARVNTQLELKKSLDYQKYLFKKLKRSLIQVKQLTGLLPICSNCKKIRNTKGYWQQVEEYIHKHSEADFTHSICPECRKKLYPDYI